MKVAKQAKVDLVLAAMPGTANEIAERSGLDQATVRRWMRRMLKAEEIHIKSERRTVRKDGGGGPIIAVYAVGKRSGKLRKLKPLTVAEVSRRYRERARASGAWEDRLARHRARAAADRASFMRDPLLAGLFGSRPAQEAANNMQWRKAG